MIVQTLRVSSCKKHHSKTRAGFTLIESPLWDYVAHNQVVFKCPADPTFVTIPGNVKPRIRSVSTSQVFDFGQWLTPNKLARVL